MKALTDHGPLVLILGLGVSVGCADDGAGTTPVQTTSETETGTTAAPETTGPGTSTGTTGTGTTEEEDPLARAYGKWYVIGSDLTVNEPEWWGSGGNSLGFALFELRAGSATIQVTSCLWESAMNDYMSTYDYTTVVDEDGVVALEPVGGVHEFKPHGEFERLYLEPGADCSALVVREVREGGEEGELFSSWGELKRGELCLEQCAEAQGEQGLISDCGTPVPWECPE